MQAYSWSTILNAIAAQTPSMTQGSTNGYAIPITTAMSIVKSIEAGGGGSPNIQVGDRAILGVSAQRHYHPDRGPTRLSPIVR